MYIKIKIHMIESTVTPTNYSKTQQTYIYTYLYPINLEFERKRNSIDGDIGNFISLAYRVIRSIFIARV